MRIERYAFGRVTIEGKTYTDDVIVYPDRVLCPWWRQEGHRLDVADLADVLGQEPGPLLIGTGASGGMEVPEETVRTLQGRGWRVRVAMTAEAVTIYNAIDPKERPIAALHLTC